MNIIVIFRTALRSLAHHKLRSLLTTLGIIIAVLAIIAVQAIGQGAKANIQKQIDSLGTNFIIVLGGAPKNLAQRRGGGAYETIKESDYQAIMEQCDLIYKASPGIRVPAKCVYAGANWETMLGSGNQDLLEIRKWNVELGSNFTKQEIRSGAKVVLIGQRIRKELFDQINPVGKIMRINKQPFRVIGVLSEKGKRPDGFDEDDVLIAPIKTVQRKLKGIRKYAAIIFSAKSKDDIGKASQEIRSILRQQHKLRPKDSDDFSIFSQADIAKASDAASMILNLLLLVIASISLIVGGIGIMNIMLVSVTERTKEIGLRLALGATTQSVRNQFILEAVIICLAGGLIGIAFGVGIAELIGILAGWPISIPLNSVLISLGSSSLIGLFFGYYPAYKASNLDPVQALQDA